jgi:hypothetical protein
MELHRQLRVLGPRIVCSIGLWLSLINPAAALCAAPDEGGKWWNTNSAVDPISVEVVLVNCGDMVLNGQETETHYGLKVFTKQSNGTLYQRPEVKAKYVKHNGRLWMYAEVPTGGYLDQMWLRTEVLNKKDNQKRLYVYINHQSLDNKPSSVSKLWFLRQPPAAKPTKVEIVHDKRLVQQR